MCSFRLNITFFLYSVDTGLLQVVATAGIEVFLIDTCKGQLDKASKLIRQSLEKLSLKGALIENPTKISERIRHTTDLQCVAKTSFVVEAIPEVESAKVALLKSIDSMASAGTVLATNTSSISITRLASSIRRPESFIGLHFMNPPQLIKLVEVIRGLATSDETYSTTLKLIEKLNAEACISLDRPGVRNE